jgi:hypothetical protein
MAVGFPQGKNEVDNRAGSAVVTLRTALDSVHGLKTFLDGKQDTDLTGLGYSQAEVTTLRAGITDLDNLYKIAHALGTQPAANDFFFNAKNLTGVA